MPSIRAVESKIKRVEGFRVRILTAAGRDIRSDRQHIPAYPYHLALKNSASVRAWIDTRFKAVYPGFEVDVLTAAGERAHGRRLLSTVRDTYRAG